MAQHKISLRIERVLALAQPGSGTLSRAGWMLLALIALPALAVLGGAQSGHESIPMLPSLELRHLLPEVPALQQTVSAFAQQAAPAPPTIPAPTQAAPAPVQDVPNPATPTPGPTNPDLVGEIRLILSPISPGAPQGQGQIQTPFGERYTGTAVWNVRNDAASPNAWGSNMNWNGFGSNAFAFALTGIEGRNLRFENSSGTYSYGCADCSVLVWESGVGTPSASTNPGILFHLSSDGQSVSATCRATECQVATPVGSRAFAASVMLSTLRESETRTFGVVQAGAAYDVRAGQGNLVCFSVFGNVKLDGTPFTPADCPGGTAVVPSRIFFGVTR